MLEFINEEDVRDYYQALFQAHVANCCDCDPIDEPCDIGNAILDELEESLDTLYDNGYVLVE